MKITEVLPVKEPKPYKSKHLPLPCANPDLIMGLELEVERCDKTMEVYQQELSKLWDVKTDGSLRGRNNGHGGGIVGNAFEFISKPAELKILIPELKEFFGKTKFSDENYSDRCSVHVHTNITNLTVHQVGTLFLTYSVVEDVLFKFVNHYKVLDPRGKYRDTNIYCVPWNQCRYNANMMQKMFSDVDYTFKQWQKYTALNILPSRTLGTVEWRHLHGTADMEKLELWLNLIGSIFKYSTSVSFEEAMGVIKTLNDNSAYQQYFNNVFGQYLPYTPDIAKELEAGVVNAKYSLLSLKDLTVKAKKSLAERIEAGQDFDEMVADMEEDAPGPFRIPPEPPPLQGFPPLQAAVRDNQVRVPPRPVRQPRPENIVRGEIEQRQQEIARIQRGLDAAAHRLAAGLTYPLQRGFIVRNGLQEWGVKDRLGIMRYHNGLNVLPNTVWEEADLQPRYVKGLGHLFWEFVTRDYRPAQGEVV